MLLNFLKELCCVLVGICQQLVKYTKLVIQYLKLNSAYQFYAHNNQSSITLLNITVLLDRNHEDTRM